jgi:hypothetical protein
MKNLEFACPALWGDLRAVLLNIVRRDSHVSFASCFEVRPTTDRLGAFSLHSSDLVYRNFLLIGDIVLDWHVGTLGKPFPTFLDAHCNLESLHLQSDTPGVNPPFVHSVCVQLHHLDFKVINNVCMRYFSWKADYTWPPQRVWWRPRRLQHVAWCMRTDDDGCWLCPSMFPISVLRCYEHPSAIQLWA